MIFSDRIDAGQKLAKVVAQSADFTGWEVVGLARGGVVVAAEIAKVLSLPMISLYIDDFHTDKAKFVITGLGSVVLWEIVNETKEKRTVLTNLNSLRGIGEIAQTIDRVAKMQVIYNAGNSLDVSGKRVILCDDGVVSGSTAISAIDALRQAGTKEILFAVPVVPASFPEEVNGCKVIYYRRSRSSSFATGMFYLRFDDVPDDEVIRTVSAFEAVAV